MHRLIGERGEEIYGERVAEISVELAMHFERGRDYKRAAYYLKLGANVAIRRFAYPEAVALARRGIELINKLPNTRETVNEALCLHLTLGVPLIAIEGYASPNVGQVYMKARELYDQLGDTPDIAEVLWGLWTFHTLSAELETARKIAEEFLHLSERLPYPGLAMRGHWAMEITYTHLGDVGRALDHYEKALALYDPTIHRDDSFLYALNPGVAMPCFAAWALWLAGLADQSLDRMEEALTLARDLSDPQGLAHAALFASILYQFRRDRLMAQYYAEAVIDISREHGLVLYGAMAMIMQGWTLSERGGDHEAIEQIREALAALDTMGTYLVRPHFLALLAEVLVKVDQTAEAMTVLDEALAMVESKGERYYEAELYRLKGELLLKQSTASAQECFERSMAIAELQQARSWQLRTAMSLARLYESPAILAPIYETFTEGFDTEDLRDASKFF
jgi:tetratricopeptide (TPR) repeat protein